MTSSEHLVRCQKLRGGITESEALINGDLAACEKERDEARDRIQAFIDKAGRAAAAERARLREGAVERVAKLIRQWSEDEWEEDLAQRIVSAILGDS